MVLSVVKNLYVKIYSQVHSQDHGLLLAGNNSGRLLVYDIAGQLVRDETASIKPDRPSGPIASISAHTQPIYSLVGTPELAVAGSSGCLSLWKWTDIVESVNRLPHPVKSIVMESDQANFGTPEINSLAHEQTRGVIWAACGDWKTRGYDLTTGKLISTLEGHKDYVHDVTVGSEDHCLATCGEDGQVLIWDSRTPREPTKKIFPYKEAALARPHLGNHITSIDYCAGEWIVCGGGPSAGVFHLRSGGLIATLPPAEPAITVAKFTKRDDASNIVTAGGDTGCVTVCNISGQVNAQIPTSARCVYSVEISHEKHVLMSVAGLGSKIDFCRNLCYKDHSVTTVLQE